MYNGALVERETTVTVNFTMGGTKEKAAAQAAVQAALAKGLQPFLGRRQRQCRSIRNDRSNSTIK
jgi:hypothetical protein